MRFLAALALVMHACWPFMGQLRAATPAMVQVVCSVHGTMLVPAEDEAPAPAEVKPACAMCSAIGFAVASTDFCSSVATTQAGSEVPQFNPAAPLQRPLHSLPSPRAPPQAS